MSVADPDAVLHRARLLLADLSLGRAKALLARAEKGDWNPDLHPRDERGRFRFWHLTADPDLVAFDRSHQGGMVHLTDDEGLRFWATDDRLDYGGKRHWAAEVEADAVPSSSAPHEWLSDHTRARVVRVVPLKEALRLTRRRPH